MNTGDLPTGGKSGVFFDCLKMIPCPMFKALLCERVHVRACRCVGRVIFGLLLTQMTISVTSTASTILVTDPTDNITDDGSSENTIRPGYSHSLDFPHHLLFFRVFYSMDY